MIHALIFAVNQVSTETGAEDHHAESRKRRDYAGGARCFARKMRNDVRTECERITRSVHEAYACGTSECFAPIRKATERGPSCAYDSDVDADIRRNIHFAAAEQRHYIEDGGHRPSADRHVRQNRMERMSYPRSVKRVFYAAVAFERLFDKRLEALREVLERRLILGRTYDAVKKRIAAK